MSDRELDQAKAVLDGLAGITVGAWCWKINATGTPGELVQVVKIEGGLAIVTTFGYKFWTHTSLLIYAGR